MSELLTNPDYFAFTTEAFRITDGFGPRFGLQVKPALLSFFAELAGSEPTL